MIRAVVFDIGGIFEVIPEGGDPTSRFPQMIAKWEEHLDLPLGTLDEKINAVHNILMNAGQNPGLGTCTEEEWLAAMYAGTGMDETQFHQFMRDYWDTYMGEVNLEILTFFRTLRPRFRTALLSNSCVGARREEEARFHFSKMTDTIIYSHEVGIEKPDPRIYAITCASLSCTPEEIVFLDDDSANVDAARTYGINAILFQNNAQAREDVESFLNL